MKIFTENIIPALICVIALIAWQSVLSRYITKISARPAPLTNEQHCTLRLIKANESETEIAQRCRDNGQPRDRDAALIEEARRIDQTLNPMTR